MNSSKLIEMINKLPVTLIVVVVLGYTAYGYFEFENDQNSPKLTKIQELEELRAKNAQSQAKVKEYSEFVRSLEAKKLEIRRLAQELQGMKATLSENIDVPSFMKRVIIEAKKIGITVVSMKPGSSGNQEFYSEQSFVLNYRGIFVQMVAFLDRLANLSQIIRADVLTMKPISHSSSQFVELEGEIELKVFKYLGSKADSITGTDEKTPAPTSTKGGGT